MLRCFEIFYAREGEIGDTRGEKQRETARDGERERAR